MGYNARDKTVLEKITSYASSLDKTYEMYNEVPTYILKVIYQEFELITKLSTNNAQRVIEQLINRTAKNYNELFPKFPSYFKRAVINFTYGKWSSWHSNYLNWEKERSEAIENKKKFTKIMTGFGRRSRFSNEKPL